MRQETSAWFNPFLTYWLTPFLLNALYNPPPHTLCQHLTLPSTAFPRACWQLTPINPWPFHWMPFLPLLTWSLTSPGSPHPVSYHLSNFKAHMMSCSIALTIPSPLPHHVSFPPCGEPSVKCNHEQRTQRSQHCCASFVSHASALNI